MIYKSLKDLRLGLGLTQAQAAKKCNISRVSFQKIESGNPTIGKLAEIAEKLDCHFEVVFSPKE